MYDYHMLEYRIKVKFGSISEFAKALGTKAKKVYKVLDGVGGGLEADEVYAWADKLEICDNDIPYYFFTRAN